MTDAELFVPGRLYTFADWHIRVGPHDLTVMCRTNARILGLMMDHLLLEEFGNLSKPPGKKERPCDLLETHADGCRSWEVKTTRQRTVNIQASREKGAGRQHDPERHANVLRSLAGFILVDQRRLPVVSFRGMSVEKLRLLSGEHLPKAIPIDFIYHEQQTLFPGTGDGRR